MHEYCYRRLWRRSRAARAIARCSPLRLQNWVSSVTVTGDETKLRECAKSNNISLENITIVHAPTVIPVDEADKDSKSVCRLLNGCLRWDSSLRARPMRLFRRVRPARSLQVPPLLSSVPRASSALQSTLVPTAGGKFYLLVDAGANHDCRPEMLCQFAVMGTAYYEKDDGCCVPARGAD